ncbi:MAG: redoxin domain-containing protein [Roseburia sp.]|nr:redoxin domain-containing protein [Roseburia sp.]
MGFSLEVSVSVFTVFAQGLLSFFSPCVLPLIPLYIGYLSGGTGVRDADGKVRYKQGKVLLHTLFFVIGISFAFVVLGLGVSAIGAFFRDYQTVFTMAGGILIILFGLYQMGAFGDSMLLGRERRLPFRPDKLAMSPFTALLMGFTFSFAWTPCVGPALASVLLMAASVGTRAAGMALIGVYTLGFVLPFLEVGVFTTSLLGFFRRHMRAVAYTVRVGGALLIFMGVLMVTGKMNAVTGYLSQLSASPVSEAGAEEQDKAYHDEAKASESKAGNAADTEADAGVTDETGVPQETQERSDAQESAEAEAEEQQAVPAPDFELKDQYGNTHTLSDYKGKTIFLNFWATWCPPCRAEMPDIQKLYESYSQEGEDALIVLGVAAPLMGQEKSEEEIAAFLEENGYTYPVLMDTEWELFGQYGIYSFPTTFMIDREGKIYGYLSGQMTYEIMESIVKQTMEG